MCVRHLETACIHPALDRHESQNEGLALVVCGVAEPSAAPQIIMGSDSGVFP